MSLYRLSKDKLEPVPTTTFIEERLLERKDLQRLLKGDIAVIGDDLMVLAEEFGDWEESNRRIDLLCLTKQAGLVVVEIKRTEDGGHMELQAIRYAAMVSSMTLDQAISAHARMLGGADAETNARREVLEFLELESAEEAELTGDVGIVLVAADFSTEVTTSVLWLNRHGLDVKCIRLKPYKMGDALLVDVAQIIPLPEAAEYEVKIRAQAQEMQKVRDARQEVFRRFWAQYVERSRGRTELYANRGPSSINWIGASIGRGGFQLNAVVTEESGRVECYIPRNKAAFQALRERKDEIEAAFGGPLDWQELPTKMACRICTVLPGGWKAAEAEWPAVQDRMLDAIVRLEQALKDPVQAVRV